MKKIYLFLAMLFGLFTSSAAFAQSSDEVWDVDEENPIITDVSQLSSPWTDPSEGSLDGLIDENPSTFWHSSWHSTPPHSVMGSHYIQVEMPEGYYDMDEYKQIAFKFVRRATNNNHPTQWAVYGTNETIDEEDPDALDALYADPMGDRETCTLLAEFSTPLTSTGSDASGETHTSGAFDPQGFKYLRFYVDETASTNGGEHNAVFWHAAEFNLYPIIKLEDWEIAYRGLNETIEKYNYESFDTGDYPGQYNDDLTNDFYDALDAAIGLINDGEATVEDMNAARQAIIDAYEAVIASRIPFNLDITEGYYRIRGAMKYINDVPTGEKDDDGNDILEYDVEVDKYMYSTIDGGKIWARWNTPKDVENDCPSLWKITPLENGNFALVNMATDARFLPVSRSASAEMAKQDTIEMAIIPVGFDIDAEQTMVNIHVIPLAEEGDDYGFLHQAGHNNGAGVSGDIVGWVSTISDNTPAASEWFIDRVSDEDAKAIIEEYAPIKDHDVMIDSYKTMLADAKTKLAEAQDIQKLVEEDKPLITDAEQFFSPFSQNDLGNKDGDDLSSGVLIDGKTDNFWHTYWGGGNAEAGSHYLQVEMPDDYYNDDTKEIVLKFTRRSSADNDHTTKWSVRGLDDFDEDIAKEDCEELAVLVTPFTSKSETIVTDPFDAKGFKYLRFYSEEQTGANYGSRGYWHVAEFQLYPGHLYQSPTCQYAILGAIAENLDKVIQEQADVEVEKLTVEQYSALKDAYDAFIAKFVNPAELREVIAAVEGKSEIVVVGTAPGFWADDSTAKTLEKTIADAKAYDEAGIYVAETSTKFIEDLKAQAEAIEPAAIPVQTGKWYRFRFGTEEEYEQYGWPTEGDDIDNRIVDEEVVGMYNEALFGKYVTVANFEDVPIDTDDNGNTVNGHRVVPIEKEDVENICMDNLLFVDEEDDILDKDLSLFRFISVGDSAFAIQNKATGLFLNNNDYVRLSVHPTLFTQHIAGYGQNAFFTKKLNGEETSPLHTARNYNILTTWGGARNGYGNSDGRRGCFFVEEAEDVAPDYAPVDFKINMKLGVFHGYCFPMDLEAEGMYSVGSIEVKEGEVAVTLVPIAKAEAGKPFIHINAGTYEPEDDDAAPVAFKHGYDIVANPIDNNILKGVFYEKEIGKGFIIPTDGGMSISTAVNQKAGNNRAYIAGEEAFDKTATVSIEIDAEGTDGIATALAKVAKNGTLYTLDGQLVSRSANLNSLRNMPKGVYILNGVKVAVK